MSYRAGGVLGLLAESLTALSPKDVIGTIEGHDHRASNSRSASELMPHPEIETFVDELERTQPSYEELVKRIEEYVADVIRRRERR
jgi:hypothetical protein